MLDFGYHTEEANGPNWGAFPPSKRGGQKYRKTEVMLVY